MKYFLKIEIIYSNKAIFLIFTRGSILFLLINSRGSNKVSKSERIKSKILIRWIYCSNILNIKKLLLKN